MDNVEKNVEKPRAVVKNYKDHILVFLPPNYTEAFCKVTSGCRETYCYSLEDQDGDAHPFIVEMGWLNQDIIQLIFHILVSGFGENADVALSAQIPLLVTTVEDFEDVFLHKLTEEFTIIRIS